MGLKQTDVLILCGGQGRRLRPCVSNRPKVLAQITEEKTFLDILLENLRQYNFERIILSIGYLGEQIKKHFSDKRRYKLVFSEEDMPLGTGGAVKKAQVLVKSEPFLVMNGDSICKIDFNKFYDFHISKKAILSVVLFCSNEARDYGTITLDVANRIISFREKVMSRRNNLINAGIYFMQKNVFSLMPNINKFSLEYDLFPRILNNGCYGFLTESECIDIGTPERFEKAKQILG